MGDTNMVDGLVDYNDLDQDGKPLHDSNVDAPQERAFTDVENAEPQTKYGNEVYYGPVVPKPPRMSVEDIQHRLRITGVRLRKELLRSLHDDDPQKWKALRRPASIHSSQRTLAEMLMSIPSADHECFHELGDGFVQMPLQAMEKYLYPTLRVMQHLHRHKGCYDYLPGGVESMMVYSFFCQREGIPQNRTKRDLSVLRNTVFPAGSDLPDQLRTNVEVTEGISTHLRSRSEG
jgi:hypothetical protein